MVATTDESFHKEHLLAKKAQGILEHQQQLQSLRMQKEELQQEKPTAEKRQLSYLESIEFGERLKKYKEDFKNIERRIQKLTRELSGLKKQAEKLLPAPGIKIKVSTYPDDDAPVQTFCIRYVKSEKANETEDQFQIQPLNE